MVTSIKREAVSRGLPRIDALERVTGQAKYAGDWKRPGMLYARIIQSSIPSGMVLAVNREAIAGKEGVADVVTCFDDNTIWRAGEREHERRLFTDRVRFVGDCVGAVAATSRIEAQRAAMSAEVKYEALPAAFTIDEAMKEGAPRIWEDGNVLRTPVYGFGDVEEALGRSATIIEGDYSTSRVHNSQIEPAVSLAWWEGSKLTVVAATQSIFGCRNGIARDLNMKQENVRVITQYKGGGFGNKSDSMNYDLIAAILSRRTGRPVMVEYGREDEFACVHGRWSSRQHLRIGVDKGGRVLAMEVKALCDIGAYTRRIKPFNFVDGAQSYYSCEAFRGEDFGIYTNTPATGHMRAPSGPQSCFASETIMDEAAYRLGFDPLEFRKMNGVRMPHNSETLTSNGLFECLDYGGEHFDWKARWMSPEEREAEAGILTGIGVSMAAWHARLGKGEAVVQFSREGKVKVHTGVVDIGTGAKTTMAKIAADAIGVPAAAVEVVWGDTDTCPYSVGESGSRTTTFTGMAVRDAALRLRMRLLRMASQETGVAADDLNIEEGEITHGGRRLLHTGELAEKMDGEITEKSATDPKLPEHHDRLAFAAHFAEVSVDTETGMIGVRNYLAVHDSGEIVNRLTASSQVQGGVVMGIGMALTEKMELSPLDGSVTNGTFTLYRIPNNTQVPDIDVHFVETADPYGPKSLGEITLVPVAAAIGNAVFNATGVRMRNTPFEPHQLLAGLGAVRN